MTTTLAVRSKVPDARAAAFEERFARYKIKNVVIVDRYAIDTRFTSGAVKRALPLFVEPLTQEGAVNDDLAPKKFSFVIEIGFLPGVTDNVATTARQTIEDFFKTKLGPREAVYSSRLIYIEGQIAMRDVETIARELYNPLIERAVLISFADHRRRGIPVIVPRVMLGKAPAAGEVNLNVADEELERIGREGIANKDGTRRGPLALDLDAMKTIRDHFRSLRRNPTDVELESLAQTWSEHCKHTIFADPLDELKEGIFKTYIRRATFDILRKKKNFCVSVFTDNAGAIAFDKEFLVTHKVETHNSPSALDPFGGAITGIVGVNRDALGFGLGAKPVANTYGFCLGNPDDARMFYRDSRLTQPLLSARRIMEGVIAGVNAGGNQSGIPSPQGFLAFDDRFRGKSLVFAGTVGLIPRKVRGRMMHKKRARPGDYIVMIGGRVGLDGIHGATFSSVALDSGSPATAVQIGDPITQKKLSDALIREARDRGLYSSITDDGAGGLSCSVAEMAKECGGCIVNLETVPLKYPGLAPWQIWISESQERMTLAVPPKKWKVFQKLMASRGVEATVIGKFTASGKCVVKYASRTVMNLDLDFLHDGRPVHAQKSIAPMFSEPDDAPATKESKDVTRLLRDMLARPNLASFAFVSQQYDHEVQAGSVTKPLQGRGRVNADATVFRPVLSSKKGVVLSQALYPWYSERDAYRMAGAAIDTAVRNVVAAGADPSRIAILDNFCWCSSKDPERLYQLKEAARACYDYAVQYSTPFISGKDSMFNDFKGFDAEGNRAFISVLPTLLISGIGLIDDAAQALTIDPKAPGDVIYLLGETKDELAGSEFEAMEKRKFEEVPQTDAKLNLRRYRAFYVAAKKNLVASAMSVTRGGLGAALGKMAIAGGLGIQVSLDPMFQQSIDPAHALFSESQGRILVTVNPRNARAFEEIMKGTLVARIGITSAKQNIEIKARGKNIVKLSIIEAARRYRKLSNQYS